MKLRRKIVESATSVAPIALARLKKEEFSSQEIYDRPSPSPDRNSADVLRFLVRVKGQRDHVIDLVKPLLTSKNSNERGWSNYILSGPVFFDDELEIMPDLLRGEDSDDVRWAILDRLYSSLSRNPDVREMKDTESDWPTRRRATGWLMCS